MIPDWQFMIAFALIGAVSAGLLLRPIRRVRCADCGTPQPDEGTMHTEECPAHREVSCIICQHDDDCQLEECVVCFSGFDEETTDGIS